MNTLKFKVINLNQTGFGMKSNDKKKEGQGGHGNMVFGKYNNKPAVYKIFTDGEDSEIQFFNKFLRKNNTQIKNLLQFIPKVYGILGYSKIEDKNIQSKVLSYFNSVAQEKQEKVIEKVAAAMKAIDEAKAAGKDTAALNEALKKAEKKKKKFNINDELNKYITKGKVLIMKNIAAGKNNILDIKIGQRNFDSKAIKKHPETHKKKDGEEQSKLEIQNNKRKKFPTIKKLGLKLVSGTVRAYIKGGQGKVEQIKLGDQNKKFTKTKEDIKRDFKEVFLMNNPILIKKAKTEITKILALFTSPEFQNLGLHFFSSSLFFAHDGKNLDVKMIDFAHVESNNKTLGLPEYIMEKNYLVKKKQGTRQVVDLLNNENDLIDVGYIMGLNNLLEALNTNNEGKIILKVKDLFSRVFSGNVLVQKLKQHMDSIAQIENTQPDYLKYPSRYNALFRVVIEQNVNNLEYNILKVLPKIPFAKENQNYYSQFLNRLKVIRSKNMQVGGNYYYCGLLENNEYKITQTFRGLKNAKEQFKKLGCDEKFIREVEE